MKYVIIIMFTVMLIITGCDSNSGNNVNNNVDVNTPKEDRLSEILSSGNYVIVDVRTKEEYETSHVKESINIPYDQIDENTDLDKTKTILVYCKSGARSSNAYETLKGLGYDVYNMGAFDTVTLEKE